MAAIFLRFADEPVLAFSVVMLAGLLQILFGTLRLGGYINLVPFPVVSGFMNGIGCIILILQLAPLLGRSHGFRSFSSRTCWGPPWCSRF